MKQNSLVLPNTMAFLVYYGFAVEAISLLLSAMIGTVLPKVAAIYM